MGAVLTRRQGHATGEASPLLSSVQEKSQLRELRHTDRQPSRWSHSSSIILVITALERFAMYGIFCNLSAFLGQSGQRTSALGLSQQGVTFTVLLFSQLPYIGALVAGTLADSRFGRYNVYLTSIVLQFVGSLFVLASAVLEERTQNAARSTEAEYRLLQGLVFTGLTFIALGISCSSGTEIPLGVDQYGGGRHRSSDGPEEAATFFYRYYFVVNVASSFSYTLLSFVQINYSFVHGFWPSCLSYFIAVILLHILRSRLICPRPGVSTLHTAFAVVAHALRSQAASHSESKPSFRYDVLTDKVSRPSNSADWGRGSASGWLDRAAMDGQFTERQIRDVRHLGGVTLVILSLTFYFTLMVETMTAFTQQGELMRLPFHRASPGAYMPSSMFFTFNPIAILIFIPILYGYIYPKLMVSDISFNLRQVRRITIGMLVAVGSLLAALLVEVARRNHHPHIVYDELSDSNLTVSNMTIFYQIPQYTLAGIAEVFVMISALEFAYYSSPLSMKGFCTGMVYGFSGIGGLLSFLLSILINQIDKGLYYQPTEPSYGHVHYFYFILLILVTIGLLLFHLAVRSFKQQPQRAV